MIFLWGGVTPTADAIALVCAGLLVAALAWIYARAVGSEWARARKRNERMKTEVKEAADES